MARELVTEKGIGERADAVWSALQKKQEEAFAVKATQTEQADGLQPESVTEETIVTPTCPPFAVTTPPESTPPTSSRGDRSLDRQLTLF